MVLFLFFLIFGTMKYMKLGSKPDAFQSEGNTIRCIFFLVFSLSIFCRNYKIIFLRIFGRDLNDDGEIQDSHY